jgi:hypothetical protein
MANVAGSASTQTIFRTAVALLDFKLNWSDAWTHDPTVRVDRVNAATAAANGVSSCTFSYRYGDTALQWETDFVRRPPLAYEGYYVRVRLVYPDNTEKAIFCGRVAADNRRPIEMAATASDRATGDQQFTAYGMEHFALDRIELHQAIFWDEDREEEIVTDWIPDLNGRDRKRRLTGGRSAAKHDGAYLFGGTDTWSNYDFAEYLLKRFVQQDSGPDWYISGRDEVIEDVMKTLTDYVQIGEPVTIHELLREVIPLSRGLDFYVWYGTSADLSEEWFEIVIYSVFAEDWTFNGQTIPKNPFTLAVNAPLDPIVQEISFADDAQMKYDRLDVIGKRIVCCCSLRADDSTLEGKWSSTLETAYEDGTGTPSDEAALHDAARSAPRFDQVFQLWAAPADWDRNGGKAAPKLDAYGDIISGSAADYQNAIRETLTWLPLQAGVDYTTDPPTDNNASGVNAQFLPPQVFLWLDSTGFDYLNDRYWPPEQFRIGVAVLDSDLGLHLQASPNHMLQAMSGSAEASEHVWPIFDESKMAFTIAFETDQRVKVSIARKGSGAGDPKKVVAEDGAEFWWLAGDTVVGIDEADGSLLTAPSSGLALRDDTDILSKTMAGAIRRYLFTRYRGSFRLGQADNWNYYLGGILTTVEENGGLTQINAPITSVSWDFVGQTSTTTINAGFAG